MDDLRYLPKVREQYEAYPFPPRDPDDERRRLIDGYIDQAALVNHYCFAGRQSFRNARILIAGGGTGDATIFWAEQLRGTDSEIVHVDLSDASIQIAKSRASIRGLENITWHQMSILDLLAPADEEPFIYVNCHGVLHHLEDPAEGLQILNSVLGEEGAMGLLLYGKYGRLALYHVQELVRRMGIQALPIEERIGVARQLMESLPETSWYKRSSYKDAHERLPDSVFFDSYLHSQDRAYNVTELYDFIETGGFEFVEFCNPSQRVLYRPETYLQDKSLLAMLPDDVRDRQAAAELLGGKIDRHECYVTKKTASVAELDDLDNIPFYSPSHLEGVAEAIAGVTPGQSVDIDRGNGLHVRFRPRQYTELIFRYLDGERSLNDIFSKVREHVPAADDKQLLEDFRPTYRVCNRVDLLLLRHKSVPRFLTGAELQARAFPVAD